MTTKNYAIRGDHDPNTLHQFHEVRKDAAYAALMADGHLGKLMPVGGVAAYRNSVMVAGVGPDIACGNAAIRTNLKGADFTDADWNGIADLIAETIAFGVGRTNKANDAPTDHAIFSDWDIWNLVPGKGDRASLHAKAQNQLGTVGGGNHYVDVFTDENDNVWVGVHFGSRGLGATIFQGVQALGMNKPWDSRTPEYALNLNLGTELGHTYWALMHLAGQYAYIGREWVTRKVVSLMGGKELELVHNHHNFAWTEEHYGERLIVVRKGATPAFPGQKGFVGGSMGDNAVILMGETDGTSHETQVSNLFSTVHGSGRVMGRAEAKKGKVIRDARGIPTGQRDTSRIITPEARDEWMAAAGVIRRGGGVDEAPQAYRRLPEVLAHQGSTIRILHTLKPRIAVMAGAGIEGDD